MKAVVFKKFAVFAETETEKKAAKIFKEEIKLRTGATPTEAGDEFSANFIFKTDAGLPRDGYSIKSDENATAIFASGTRGFIYGVGRFLRKIVEDGENVRLSEDISGSYVPDKIIRGHQLGYRTTPNTYDAWSYADYRRYYLDIMFFGSNTVEHVFDENDGPRRNALMKYDPEEFLAEASRMADELDLDVSLWNPNKASETAESAAERRGRLYAKLPRLDAVFPPGGDPGELEAEEFVHRCKEISRVLKKVRPSAQMWPSAQRPRAMASWGENFIEEMKKLPDEIDGVIEGPNKALPLDVLRRELPDKYPIRLYPDITHNVRCEYPVRFDRDDWHFALAACLSRESVNPRPREYRLIHRLTRRYVVGSVSYSEGVHDDVNKMIWADMDYSPDCELRTSLLDYCRLFFYGADAGKLADAIASLEINWEFDPAENPTIDRTLETFKSLAEEYPFLCDNWRFLQLFMRAKCDYIVRSRRIFELDLIKLAEKEIRKGDLAAARGILSTDFDDAYKKERSDAEDFARKLFELIGAQLDVERYGADGWDRGAVLDTLDLPVTDRKRLLRALDIAENSSDPEGYMIREIDRNRVGPDEYYFSVALNGLEECGARQTDEVYINFQGDSPNKNTGAAHTSTFKVFDSRSFKCKVGGLTSEKDYKLKITYLSKKLPFLKDHKITANGTTIYEGPQFGGERDEEYDREAAPPGFETATYPIPRGIIENGCLDLEFSEPYMGVMFCEFRIIHD